MFKILVSADPHPAFQEVMTALRGQGFELEEVACQAALSECSDMEMIEGVMARVLEKTQACRPDLVLLTSELPENKSLKLCKNLKSNPQTESIPVVFLNHGQELSRSIEGLECGANDILYAPSQPGPEHMQELLARINAAIRTKMSLNKSKALADQLNQMNSELYERNLAIEKELYTTRQLQQSLLPPFLKEDIDESAVVESATQLKFSKCHFKNEHVRISGVYLPCDALGGDLYDVIQFADQSIGVSIADVSGHGVPAAFVTAIFKASFYRTTHSFTLPGDVLFHLNNELMNIIKTGQYVTTVYSRLMADESNPGEYRMQFSGAGHPYPFYYRAETNTIERLQENGTPLAWFASMDYPMGEITLKKGDKVLLFSDGISEMKNIRGDMYGEEALQDVFQRLLASAHTNQCLLDKLLSELSDFTEGHPLDDDVSVVLIEMT